MKVIIDPEVCQGHLRCHDKAPDLFDVDEQGHGIAPSRDLESDEEIALARLAESACPEGAIRLEP